MRYLIDGYNYLHAVGLLRPRTSHHAGPHELERARRQFLGQLEAAFPSGDITIVFDAAAVGGKSVQEEWHSCIHVFYETRRQADDLLEDLIRRDSGPKTLAVVSDDHRVRDAAARRGCVVLHCEEFAATSERTQREKHLHPVAEKPNSMSAREAEEWARRFGEGDADR